MNPAVVEAKRRNTKKILWEIILHPDISRLELSQRFHLSAATVAIAINELLEKDLVVEGKVDNASVGRKAKLLKLNEKARTVLAVHLSSENCIELRLCDLAGNVESARTLPADFTILPGQAQRVVEEITSAAANFLAEQPAPLSRKLLGCGVIVPGVVYRDGTVDAPLFGWRRTPIEGAIQSRIGVPVFADTILRINGKYETRCTPSNERVVYLSLEYGVGLTYFEQGKLLLGKNLLFGEVGHISLNEAGPPCYCGNRGCFESYCGTPALLERLGGLLEEGGCPILQKQVHANGGILTLPAAFAAYRQGSTRVQAILTETGEYLGRGLITICNILDPDRVILAGDLVSKDDYVLQTALTLARKRILARGACEPEFQLAKFSPAAYEKPISAYVLERLEDQLLD